GSDDAAPKAERPAHLGGEARGEIKPQHVERAVGDVDDAGDAENERQPGAHEKQARGGGEPVERLKEEGFKTHGTKKPRRTAPRSPRARRRTITVASASSDASASGFG